MTSHMCVNPWGLIWNSIIHRTLFFRPRIATTFPRLLIMPKLSNWLFKLERMESIG